MATRNIKLVLEYDGTEYCGWQTQTNGRSIQEAVEVAIQNVIGSDVALYGSGRTDSGVHALGQVANFHADTDIPCGKLCHAINAHLPHDISVLHTEDEDEEFHARFSVKSKMYRYVILNRPCRPALERHRCFFIRGTLDMERMRETAFAFVGRHDFTAFCAEAPEDATREIIRLDIQHLEDIIAFEVEAGGFLYNMVRRIVGSLLEVGRGKLTREDVELMFATRQGVGGPTVPPHGLYLIEVKY